MRWNLETRYKLLLEINNAVITNTSEKEFFEVLSTELKTRFNYDRLSIFLYKSETQSLKYFTLADGIQPEGFSFDVRPLAAGSIANMAIKSLKPVIIDDLAHYSDHTSIGAMLDAGLKTTMAFPLVVRSKTLGTLHMSFKKTPEHLSELSEILNDVSNQVAIAIGNMISYTRLKNENENLERKKQYLMNALEDYQPHNFIYNSPPMFEIMKLVERVADIDAPILITGETGTGKDYLARYIHSISPRQNNLFVKINCPALSSTLFESELFGHAKGAFTGAESKRSGRFEMADNGTIFLDEIAELPINLQAKLLQVIQEKQFERVGENRPIKINFRLIAATNRDLFAHIQEGKFRQDLFYRLNLFQIHIPPLKERQEDIPLLIEQINKDQSRELKRDSPKYTKDALKLLCGYNWPGNVRELKNLVKRLLILKPGEKIRSTDLEHFISTEKPDTTDQNDSVFNLAEIEQRSIERALIKTKGAVGGAKGAAKLLGVPKSTLQYRMKKYNLNPSDYAS